MFNTSDSSISLQLTEKLYTFPLKDTSLESIVSDFSNIFPRKKWVGKLKLIIWFKDIDFFFVNKQTPVITNIMQTLAKYCL